MFQAVFQSMRRLWRAGRWWLPPALAALALALVFRDPFIGDWDALDYTVLALRGEPSSMALGRMLFVGYNHALWRLAQTLLHLTPERAYLLFQYAVIAQAPLAAVACWALARAASGSRRVATLAALLVGTSPMFAIYSGQVMTEIPSLLVATCALLLYLYGAQHKRAGLMLAGAALLGLGVNLRESVAFFGVWLALAPLAGKSRSGLLNFRVSWRSDFPVLLLSVLVFVVCAFGPFALWFGWDVGGYRGAWYGWLDSMRMESARHPVTWLNLGPFVLLFAFTAPLFFLLWPFALYWEWQQRRFSPSFALGVTGVLATGLLFFNYSTTINARYFLSGLPALAPVVAAFLWHKAKERTATDRRAFVWALVCVCGMALVRDATIYLQQRHQQTGRLGTKTYLAQLTQIPPDGVVLAGAQTVAVTYWHGVGIGQWEAIGTGGGWPGPQLVPVIQNYLAHERRVFLDTDPRWWAVCGWQAQETLALPQLEEHFRFRRINATLYEIRPPSDMTAQDAPLLMNLLPEYRPNDKRKCFNLGK